MNAHRVLVYRAGALGDTIVALPAIHAVRDHFDGSEFALMTASGGPGVLWADQVLAECGWFDTTITYGPDEFRRLDGLQRVLGRVRAFKPDVVVYLASDWNSGLRLWRDRVFFRLAGARRFLATPSGKVTFLGRRRRVPAAQPSEIDRLLDGVRGHGIVADRPRFDLPIQATHEAQVEAALAAAGVGGRPLVAVCPGSKQPAKRWPMERYGEIGRRLIEDGGVDVVVCGGDDDGIIGHRLAAAWPVGRWAVTAGSLDVLASAALLRRCVLYVGNDTGAMHLAAAVDVPCVVPFGARDLARSWHPYGAGHIVLQRAVSCANCYLSACRTEGLRCLTAITVDDVWDACRRQLMFH